LIEADLIKILIVPIALVVAQINKRLLEILVQKVLLYLLATQVLQAGKVLARKLKPDKAFRHRRAHHRIQLVLIIVNTAFIPNGQVAKRNAHENTVLEKRQSTIISIEQAPDPHLSALVERVAVRMRFVVVPNEAFVGQPPAEPIAAD
jgi:hypothetical protein